MTEKTILITGATDGIGLETAKALLKRGHRILIHGRNPEKLEQVEQELKQLESETPLQSYLADLSDLNQVASMAQQITEQQDHLDIVINNAGIFRSPDAVTSDGLDVRFAVNTIAPYVLTHRLLPLMTGNSRIVNLSSAAQATVNLQALKGETRLTDEFDAYAQSKLALTMWTNQLAVDLQDKGIIAVSVNPGSLLATKMVKQGFGMDGHDINIGVDILLRAALSDEFQDASGKYFDNDSGCFSNPHSDAMNVQMCIDVASTIDSVIS